MITALLCILYHNYYIMQINHEQGIITLMLFLYLCAGESSLSHLLKQNCCLEVIGPYVQFRSTEVNVLSKALIARLIPTDAVSDDSAVLILIKDDEVEYLRNLIRKSSQSYQAIPVVSVMMDLARSPHNLFALASIDMAIDLSDLMETFSEDDQARSAQLIWKLMELDYDGNEEVTAIRNNGSLEAKPKGYYDMIY